MFYALNHKIFDREMRHRGIKEEEMAEKIEVSDRHIRNLKVRDVNVSSSVLFKISIVFQIPMEELLVEREEGERG